MKPIFKILFIVIFILFSGLLFSQNPPHPNGGSAPGTGNTPVGGGAPIGGGLIIMLASAVVYGMKKRTTTFKI